MDDQIIFGEIGEIFIVIDNMVLKKLPDDDV